MRFASGSRCPLVAQTQLEDVADSLHWRTGWHTNRARGAFTVSWKRLALVPHAQGSETRAPAACPLARIAKEIRGWKNPKWVFNLQHGSWQEYQFRDISSHSHDTATLITSASPCTRDSVRLIVGVKKKRNFPIIRDEAIKGQHV